MNSMRSIGEQLHDARMAHGMSLEDIASATRINVKFLKEIEEGKEPAVPQTYVRAFIKAFAERVNVDANEILRQLQIIREPNPSPATLSPGASPASNIHSPPPESDPLNETKTPPSQKQIKPLLTLIVILLAGLILYVLWLRSDRNERPVEEISFGDVVKEQEAKKPGAPPEAETSAVLPAAKVRPPAVDSLSLEASAGENVWIHVTIDGRTSKEYMMTKYSRLHWKAKTSFLVSVGNATGISLILNGQRVQVAGNDSLPVRNITLSRETLQKLQRSPAKMENE